MNNKIVTLIIVLSIYSCSNAQDNRSDFNSFTNTGSYNVIKSYLSSKGEVLEEQFLDGRIGITDFNFYNLLTKESYKERENGIWVFGIKSQENPNYIYFKYGEEQTILGASEFAEILTELNSYVAFDENLSKKERLELLFEITLFINEESSYPIECLEKCY